VIYVLNAKGMTIAASNWREPTSFVGSDYSFRPYFKEAAARGVAELFALGTVSRRPGLFMSRRVDGPRGHAGRRGREGRVRGAGGRMVEPPSRPSPPIRGA
jgi:two-component system C4-dicarboxylate transport sensor histidine kinase DctB